MGTSGLTLFAVRSMAFVSPERFAFALPRLDVPVAPQCFPRPGKIREHQLDGIELADTANHLMKRIPQS
jgi:hypothetical protein